MTNLKERKEQIEKLMESLQAELNHINEQLKEEEKEIKSDIEFIEDGDFVTLKNNEVELTFFYNPRYEKSKKFVQRATGEVNGKNIEVADVKNQWKAMGRKRLSQDEFNKIVELENRISEFGLTIYN